MFRLFPELHDTKPIMSIEDDIFLTVKEYKESPYDKIQNFYKLSFVVKLSLDGYDISRARNCEKIIARIISPDAIDTEESEILVTIPNIFMPDLFDSTQEEMGIDFWRNSNQIVPTGGLDIRATNSTFNLDAAGINGREIESVYDTQDDLRQNQPSQQSYANTFATTFNDVNSLSAFAFTNNGSAAGLEDSSVNDISTRSRSLSGDTQTRLTSDTTSVLDDLRSLRYLSEGQDIESDAIKQKNYIGEVIVPLSSYVGDSYTDMTYDYDVLEAPARRHDNSRNRSLDLLDAKSSTGNELDPVDLIDRINFEQIHVSESIYDKNVISLSSEVDLDSTVLRAEVLKSRPSFYFDTIKHFLRNINVFKNLTTYNVKRVYGQPIQEIPVTIEFQVDKTKLPETFKVKFLLYKLGESAPAERIVRTVSIKNYVETSGQIMIPPDVTTKLKSNGLVDVKIIDLDLEKKTKSYKVFLKEIDSNGVFSSYKLVKIAKLDLDNKIDFQISTKTNLSVLKVVPYDEYGRESNVFTGKIIGPGYRSIGNLTLVVSQTKGNVVKCDVYNLPKNTKIINVYRRDCTISENSNFSNIATYNSPSFDLKGNYSFSDREITKGRIYEYFVTALPNTNVSREDDAYDYISNTVMWQTMFEMDNEDSVVVQLSDFKTTLAPNGLVNSFRLKTTVKSRENAYITNLIKTNMKDLYDQYLNPSNTNGSSSPLKDKLGIPDYEMLYVHEVVRTNLTTGERETFELISDGLFEDSPESRYKKNINPIDETHNYFYQVFTFRKNPFELFQNIVAYGNDSKGKTYFYRPLKWKNAKAIRGVLYSDDIEGVPEIPAYQSLTETPLGETASYTARSSLENSSISNVVATREDKETIKIEWKTQDRKTASGNYDSFVVLKVVNNVRKFVGRTHTNKLYHKLSRDDLGNVYYIVVPIMHDLKIDDAAASNNILIKPDGLTEVIAKQFYRRH